jgi:Flp pilus assembly protein TadD
MRVLLLVLFLLCTGLSGLLGGGCASRAGLHTTWRPGEHQKLLEKQKTARSIGDEAPKNLPDMTATEYEIVGDNYLLQNNLPMAFVQYDKALRMAPNKISVQYKKASIFLKRGLLDQALQAFQDMLNADDTFALAHEGIGQTFLLLGKFSESEVHLQRAIALDTSLWKSHNFLGMVYDHQRRFDAAIAAYKAAMALKKDDGSLCNNLGVSYAKKGEYDYAMRAFEQALSMGYTDARVYNNLGLALTKLGRAPEALIAFTRGGDKSQAYNNLGVIYLTEGKYREAVAAFEKAIEASPRFYTTASENLRIAQQALAESPSDASILSVPAEGK